MKTRLFSWLFILILLGFCGYQQAEAQTKVGIQTKKIVVPHSPKVPVHRGDIIIRYPILSGLTNAPLLKRLQRAVMPQGAYKGSLAEMKKDEWLDEVEYTVNCNQNSLLDITYQFNGQGAYPDDFEEYVTLNIKTGKKLRVSDLFNTSTLPRLAALVNVAMQADIKKAIKSVDTLQGEDQETRKETKEQIREMLSDVTFKPKDLAKFTVGKQGVTFHYDFGFPHVIQALEPEGRYFLPYSALKPFVRRDGLLNAFVP